VGSFYVYSPCASRAVGFLTSDAICYRPAANSSKSERRIIYTSLYGVNSVDEISKQIIVNAYLEKAGKAKSLIQTSSKIFGAALSLLPAFGIDIDVKELSGKLSELLQVKNSILVFDDLERCDCPINDDFDAFLLV
jgi:hypothetical protein